jgi:NADPH:quinone reductase-like Zn-dependent oxidoreductase
MAGQNSKNKAIWAIMAISMHFFFCTVCLLLLDLLPTLSLSMSPRRILVTGANTGIGLALTKQLVKDHGCHVYLGSRSVEKGKKAVDEVKREAGDSVELLNIVSCYHEFDFYLVSILYFLLRIICTCHT